MASAWVDVDADTDPADRKIDALIARLEKLGSKKWKAEVGVDGADQAVAATGKVDAAVAKVGRRTGRGKVGVDGADTAVASIDEVIGKLNEAGLTVRTARLRVKEEGLDSLHQVVSELRGFGVTKVSASASVKIGDALVNLSALKAAQDAASASALRLGDTTKYLSGTFGISSPALKAQTLASKQLADMNNRLADSFRTIRSQATPAALSTAQLAAAEAALNNRFTANREIANQAAVAVGRYTAALKGADEITAEATAVERLLTQGRLASMDTTLAVARSQKILAASTDEAITKTVQAKIAADGANQATTSWMTNMIARIPWVGGLVRTEIPLWGGAFTQLSSKMGGILPRFLQITTGFGLLAHGILELSAVLIPATIAFAAFGAAAVPSVQDIVTQMTNLKTVTEATGQNLYPLTGGFQKVADSVRPQVYQIFGDALTVMNQKTGEFAVLAKGAGAVLDQLAARLTTALTRGKGFGQFLKNAVPDLQQLGTVVANIGGIIGNFLKQMPGYANVLLTGLTGITHVVQSVTGSGLVQHLIGLGLAAHGAFLYLGLAGTALAKFAPAVLTRVAGATEKAAMGLVKLGTTGRTAGLGFRAAGLGMGAFSTVASEAAALPWGWIAVAAAAVGILAYKFITAKDSADGFIASFNQGLAATPLNRVTATISSGLTVMNAKLAAARIRMDQLPGSILPFNRALAPVAPGLQNVTNALDKIGKIAPGALDLLTFGASTAAKALLDSAAPAATAVHDWQAARSEVSKLSDQAVTFRTHLWALALQFHGTAAAMGILNAAGITESQMTDKSIANWVQVQVQVQGTINAYRAMGQRSGMLGADMNALTIAGSDQVAAMSKLNQSWDTTIGIVSGGQGSFITFQQSLLSVGMALAGTGGHARVVTSTFAAAAAAAKAAGASMNGINAPSLQLRATWQSAYANGAKLIDALRMMSSMSAGGFPSLQRAIKDVVAELAPLGSLSDATRAQLIQMASEAGVKGVTNWQSLVKWLGNTKNAAQDLNSVVAKSGVNLHDLAGVAASLSSTMQSQLSQSFVAAKFGAAHVTDALRQLAKAEMGTGDAAARQKASLNLFNSLMSTGMYTAQQARTAVLGFGGSVKGLPTSHKVTISHNLTAVQAKLASLQRQLDALHGKTVTIGVNTAYSAIGAQSPFPFFPSSSKLGPAAGGMVTSYGVLTPHGLARPLGAGRGVVVPGYAPGRDTAGPYMLSPGEGVLVPEAVRGIGGPAAIYGLNRRFGGARVTRGNKTGTFATGGITTSAYGIPAGDIFISVNVPPPSGYASASTVAGIIDKLMRNPPKQTQAQQNAQAARQRVRAFEWAGKVPALEFARGMTDVANIQSATKTAIDAIRQYYTGPTMHRLISVISAQSKDLQTLAKRNDAVVAEMAAMKAYASSITGNLASSYSDLSNIQPLQDAQGNPVPVSGMYIKSQLTVKLARLRRFLSDIRLLSKDKLGKTLIGQVIAMGPDLGVEYAEAILHGGPGLISDLRSIESQIGSVETQIGQTAADIQFGQSISKGFLSGLQAQHARLLAEMRKLGDEIALELAKDFGDKALAERLKHQGSGGGGTGPGGFIQGHVPHNKGPGSGPHPPRKHAQTGAPVVINFNGVAFPNQEQVQSLKMALASAVSNA